jgi:hypothetical protein
MRFLAILLLGLAALAALPGEALARDGCGRGWYWNGYACVPTGTPRYRTPPPYAYGPPRPVGSQYCDRYGRCYRTPPHSCSTPGYTVQDGVCKPYRGY